MLTPLLTISLIAQPAPQIAEGAQIDPDTYEVVVMAEGLEQPWDMSWLPNGDMLVTERAGRLRVIRDGELLDQPVTGLPDNIHVNNQAGLFEAVPHPEYASNNQLYLTYAATRGDDNTLVLGRGTYTPNGESGVLSNFEVLFEATPFRDSSAHYGARIAWLEDGTMLLTNGEGYRYREEAQRLDNHYGKILHLTADGDPADGNPFADRDGALPEIWSYGHRNPQGIVRAPDGKIYENEHGPRGGDELNIIEPGTNYGWPVITYGIDYSGAEISPFTEMDGMAQPLFHWTPSIAPSSLLYYDGGDFPDFAGKLLTGSLSYKHVSIADPTDPDGQQFEMLGERDMRVRDVALSPDGTLHVATETREGAGGEILRILPKT